MKKMSEKQQKYRMEKILAAQKTPVSYAKSQTKLHKSYNDAEDLPRY